MKYLQSHDRTEQRGRAEDGPVGLKHKWSDWPNVTPQANLINAGAKKKAGKATPPSSKPSTPTQGAPKK
jgi:hypothetical protein